MEVRTFSVKEALRILGIKPPRIRKGMKQAEVDALVDEWKETTLEEHYKKVRREAHPDLPTGSEQRFKDVTAAYEEVKEHLKLRVPVPKPSEVTECRRCGAQRVPQDAAHCHECGTRYRGDEPRTVCPVCGALREPGNAKFCHGCGYDYQVIDGLIERLLAHGFSENDIDGLRIDGTLDKWRRMPAISPELARDIDLKLKLIRIGYGRGSLGRGFI